MKRLLIPLFCLLLLSWVSSTGARMNVIIVGGGAPAAPGASYEDFTTYTCYEDGGATSCGSDDNDLGELTITSSTAVNFVDITNGEVSYIAKDYGVDHADLTGDWVHRFEVVITAVTSDYADVVLWGVCEGAVDTTIPMNKECYIFATNGNGSGSERLLHVQSWSQGTVGSGVFFESTASNLTLSTRYYVTVSVNEDGGANGTGYLTAVIRTGSHDGSVFDTINADRQSAGAVDGRTIYVTAGLSSVNTGRKSTGETANLELNP